ncbi:hypothetical protein ACEN9F_30795 [Duganella sp. CT11-25]|uniref:hypothetical protein n=1 Tax=unclassified Duganella TaxID=2636909 RepID=UPI0039AEB527
MDDHDQLARWLQAQPLGARVAIDGESVWLQPGEGGAELAACLWHDPSREQVLAAMRYGFASAQEFYAGLSLADDGRGLVLSCWLPSCRGWSDAAPALEQLLDQLAVWRAALAPPSERQRPGGGSAARHEQRMRNLLTGAWS